MNNSLSGEATCHRKRRNFPPQQVSEEQVMPLLVCCTSAMLIKVLMNLIDGPLTVRFVSAKGGAKLLSSATAHAALMMSHCWPLLVFAFPQNKSLL